MSRSSGGLIDVSGASSFPVSDTLSTSNSTAASDSFLSRTSTHESRNSAGSQEGAGVDGAGGLSSFLSSTIGYFGRRSESKSGSDSGSHQPSAIEDSSSSTPVLPGALDLRSSGGRQVAYSGVPIASTSRTKFPEANIINVRPDVADSNGSSSGSQNSLFSNKTANTARTSPLPSSSSLSTEANRISYANQPALSTQARMKTLPRLDSYRVAQPDTSLSRVDSRESESERDDDDKSSTGRSANETEQEAEETETDDDDDDGHEDDHEFEDRTHDEEDARGGAAAMHRSMARPALPTLTSTRGFSRSGPISPLHTPDHSGTGFFGWTTFASSTPTPGPLRTARPLLGDNAADGSYFDARPVSSSSNRTPAQTPRILAGDRGSSGRVRSPQSAPTPGAISPQFSRTRHGSRQQSPQRLPTVPSSSLATYNMQVVQPIGISPIPESPKSANRPSFYQRQSRSLVDLTQSLDHNESLRSPMSQIVSPRPNLRSGSPTNAAESPVARNSPNHTRTNSPLENVAPAEDLPRGAARLPSQRRRSMPEMRIDPPVYSVDDDCFVQYRKDMPFPAARDEEGREPLPSYTCDVHIEGYVPRKMEFSKPGVQSKDRSWKRQYIILHGTSIKVYKADPRAKAVLGQDAPPSPGIPKSNYKTSHAPATNKVSSSAGAPGRSRRMTDASMSSLSSANSGDSEKSLAWNRARESLIAQRQLDPDIPVHVHLQDDEEGGLSSFQHPGVLLAKASENRIVRHYTLQGEVEDL